MLVRSDLLMVCIAGSRKQGAMEQTANVRDTASKEVSGKSQPAQYLHGLAMAPFT